MLEIKHLRTLTALRDSGSLVDAAKRLHLTQSALSHQISDLESRLGLALFHRKTKPLRFSRAGLELLQLASQVLPLMHQAERAVQQLRSGTSGRLHIVLECHSCFDWLIPAINQFRDQWPEVEIDLGTSFHFEPIPALHRGDIDLVITSDPMPSNDVKYVPLFRYQSMLAVSHQHPLANKDIITPEDLRDETLIHYPVDRSRLDVFTRFLQPAGIEPSNTRQTELTLMMVQLVASQRGVACLPNWALQPYVDNDLICTKSLGEKGVWPTLYAAVRADSMNRPYVQDFLQLALTTCFDTLTGILPAE